ncbi:DNA cytosine methyltransferase [Lysobacter enzymogenes]|nr:DNA cytosine methyltransferase [Lysobacter enzymogenes]QCW28120.1 DNA cytosine methyltransferase [Lysobacter enzymogenes]
MKHRKIKALDLFCGAGGLTYGLRQAGIEVVAGVDVDPACEYPYEANNNSRFLLQDVATLTVDQVNRLFGQTGLRLIAGCAPCQPFSSHRKGLDTSSDPKWPLLDHFSRIVRGVLPEFVTMENVTRIQRHEVFLRFVEELKTNGYKVVWRSLYCPNYGIPQERRRLVLLASRIGEISLPSPTHEKGSATVRRAIGRLPALQHGKSHPRDTLHITRELSPINLKRMQHSTPGGTWAQWPQELRSACHNKSSGKSFKSVYARMSWDQPSPTITTQFFNFGTGRFGHPDQDRAISLREGAVLQSFPRDYKFVEKGRPVHKQTIGRLIGNAVPPLLGEAIGKSIKAAINPG